MSGFSSSFVASPQKMRLLMNGHVSTDWTCFVSKDLNSSEAHKTASLTRFNKGAESFWSRFKLSVSAGSQKRTIHKPEGKDESRFSLKSKRNRNVTIVKYILSLLGQIVSLLGQTNCLGLRTLCQKRLHGVKNAGWYLNLSLL